jgi:hypothetical protein
MQQAVPNETNGDVLMGETLITDSLAKKWEDTLIFIHPFCPVVLPLVAHFIQVEDKQDQRSVEGLLR